MVLFLSLATLLLAELAACGSPGHLPAVSGLSLEKAAPTMVTPATVTLRHAPSGSVDLTWNVAQKTLTIAMNVSGLTPGSVHPTHLHLGTCQAPGRFLFLLPKLQANAVGQASMQTVIHNVIHLPKQWVVNIHNGPTMTPPVQSLPIACGTLTMKASTTTGTLKEHVALQGTNAPNESVSGTVQLSLTNAVLTVTVSVHGLQPGSRHAAHIHLGHCAAQGKMLSPLLTLVGNAHGDDRETTTLHGVTLPASWYINIHFAEVITTPQGQIIPEAFNPIACADQPTALLRKAQARAFLP